MNERVDAPLQRSFHRQGGPSPYSCESAVPPFHRGTSVVVSRSETNYKNPAGRTGNGSVDVGPFSVRLYHG